LYGNKLVCGWGDDHVANDPLNTISQGWCAMNKDVKFAVLGGGQVMAAHLAMEGFKVNPYEHPNFRNIIDPVIEQGGILPV